MKFLIIGLGSIAKKHIAAIQKEFSNAEIYGLRSSVNSSTYKGIVNIYSLKDLEIQPDFIIISNPTHLHVSAISECLKFKVPLFIEKPLSHSLKEIENILETIRENNIQTYVACNLRFLDSLQFIKNYIKDNNIVIHELNAYCGSYLPDWRPGTNYKSSYSANDSMGGGVHLDLIHELDYVYWIFGPPLSVRKHLTNKSELKINSADYANYLLEFDNFSANIILNYYRRDPKRSLELVCTDNTYHVDLLKNEITSMKDKKIIFSSGQTVSDTYASQIKYFVENIQQKSQLMNEVEEAYKVLQICLN